MKKEPVSSTSVKLDPGIAQNLQLVRKKAASLPARISSPEEQQRIAAHQTVVHDLIKSIEAWYKKHIDPIDKALRVLRAEKKALLTEPEAWDAAASRLLSAYYQEQEAVRREKEHVLQEKLDREAAAARAREVAALKKSGDKSAALALASAPVVAPVAVVPNAATVVGKTFRDDVEVQIVSLAAVPNEYVKRELRLAEVKAAWRNGIREIPGLLLRPVKTLVNL